MRVAMIALAVSLAACSPGSEAHGDKDARASGSATSRSFAASGFTSVELHGPDDVQIRNGSNFSVRAEGPSDVLDRLEVRVDGGALKIGREGKSWNWGESKGAKIFVTLPRLTGATIAGSGNMDIDRGEGQFAGAIAGSGDLKIGTLNATATSLSIKGSGDITASGGSLGRLNAAIAGSGDIDARGARAQAADISIAGSGNVRAQVHGNAAVNLMGAGDVELTGGAQCTVARVGSGEAHCS